MSIKGEINQLKMWGLWRSLLANETSEYVYSMIAFQLFPSDLLKFFIFIRRNQYFLKSWIWLFGNWSDKLSLNLTLLSFTYRPRKLSFLSVLLLMFEETPRDRLAATEVLRQSALETYSGSCFFGANASCSVFFSTFIL